MAKQRSGVPRFYRTVVDVTEERAEDRVRAAALEAGWTNLTVRSIASDVEPDGIRFHVVMDGVWPRRKEGMA